MYCLSQSFNRDLAAKPLTAVVYVVDDDHAVGTALVSLFRAAGFAAEAFGSSAEFLACRRSDAPSCLILDVLLRDENGLDFQSAMNCNGLHMPVVFVSANDDVATTVKAMKAGATDFFVKPVKDQELLDAVSRAVADDSERLQTEAALSELRARYDALTPRECQVVPLLMTGLLNKQIADKLNVSVVTVKLHRGRIMKKMDARSLVALVYKLQSLGIKPPPA